MAGTLTPALGTVRGARAAAEPTAALYVALHCDHPTRPPSRHFLADTDVVSLGRAAAQEARRRSRQLELSIAAGWMSTRQSLLKRAVGSGAIAGAGPRHDTRPH